MKRIQKQIKYSHPNIAHFPALAKYLNHGFSWGKEAGNMEFAKYTDGNKRLEVRNRIQSFLETLNMDGIKESVNMLPEQGTRIIDVDKKLCNSSKKSRWGINMKCDVLFTKTANITLTTKVADCTTAVVNCKYSPNEEVVGIIHTGRRGVEAKLPQKAIQHLLDKYNCKVSNIKLGILPQLSQWNRRFENLDDFHDLKVWKGFMSKKNGFYYPDEIGCALKQYHDIGIDTKNIHIYDIDTYKAASKGITFSYKYHLEMAKQGKKVPDGRLMLAVRKK